MDDALQQLRRSLGGAGRAGNRFGSPGPRAAHTRLRAGSLLGFGSRAVSILECSAEGRPVAC